MKVLIGTDGSDDAIAAARRALELLDPSASVTVAAIMEEPVAVTAGFESGFAGGMATPEEVQVEWEAAEGAGRSAVADTVAALDASSPVEQVVRVGSAGAELCRLATELDADVLVVGSRGRGAIKRALLGSVSSHVVHNAPCPVMVIRAGVLDGDG